MTRVVVAGAGIGGLTLGIALARAGIAVDLYERADELREVGAAVALSANGSRHLHRLGVGDALDAVSTQPTELIYRDGRTGARIAAHPGGGAYRARFGAPYWGVHRIDLQQTLAAAFTAAAGAEHLHLGHAITAVDAEAGALTLDDGRTVTGDVVVGADGVRSIVREAVAGPGTGPTYSGTSGFRGLVPIAALPSLPDPHAIQFWAGPGAHLLHYALGRDDDTVNFLAVLCGPETWDGAQREVPAGELLEAFAGWHPAVREMLAAVPQSPRWPLLAQAPLRRWTRGRTALLGDACHAMLPHHGQGANQAIEDAATLARLLVEHDPATALAAYPGGRRARTRAVAASAWDTGTLLHLDDDHPRLAERDKRFAGYLPDNAWVHDHDAALDLDHHLRRTTA
ncbi:FAD-dependent monooxygenase [Actinomycetospora sp. C-140]